MFINFPYTDLYALNLDWILQQITAMKADNQTIEDLINSLGTVVNTVNGQSGNVTITDTMVAGAKLESVYVAPNTPWSNIVGNITNLYNAGIRMIVCGNNDRDLYVLKMSGGNVDYARYNPLGSASTFVESVNGQSGAINITDSMINATDINIFEWADPGETINDYSSASLLNLYDNGIRIIFTQNTFGDYANMYTLYKSGGAVSYVAYEPTSAVAGVLSVNGMSGAVTLTASDVGAVPTTTQVNGNPLTSDVVLTAGDVGAVPTSRTVNNKALSSNITLTAGDVSAVPTTRTVNNKALSTNISLTASDVGAVPTTRTVNNKSLSSDITLNAGDVNAVPTTRTVNNKALSSNITLGGSDIVSGVLSVSNTVNQDITAVNNKLVTDGYVHSEWFDNNTKNYFVNLCKILNRVQMHFYFHGTSNIAKDLKMGEIPASYRPSADMSAIAYDSTGSIFGATIHADGTITHGSSSARNNITVVSNWTV